MMNSQLNGSAWLWEEAYYSSLIKYVMTALPIRA